MQRLYAGLASQVQRNHMGSLGMLKINVERYVGACILAASTRRRRRLMTKPEILRELLMVGRAIADHKRGQGSLTALKAYERKLYKAYTACLKGDER